MNTRRALVRALSSGLLAATFGLTSGVALAAPEAPDVFIKRLTTELLDIVKADKTILSGDVTKIGVLVDQRVMPHVNFQRMTSSAVGPGWRQATPDQQKRLQEEFKALLVRTYAGAVSQINNQTIVVKPLRAAADDVEVIVRTEVHGKGDPLQLDYRVEKSADAPSGWRIYNLNVMGVWLVENYRSQFAQEINAKGVDGLIASLVERNKANARVVPK
ncbi:phospholipid-binding protein MlaC [Limnohabitans sp. B9-3]|uniref:MlaC/ttg2D family ABC transporter substrate-binding protein n=1 Tax=Limnohabitans sp. B9-3 TaxID=1100707 RepID=UPI000C1E4842|nr:ABC transporter substrate-binding protein [Limnohabitans sp. B9-3]